MPDALRFLDKITVWELYNITECCLSYFAWKRPFIGKSLPYSSANGHGPGRNTDSQKSTFFSMLVVFSEFLSAQTETLKSECNQSASVFLLPSAGPSFNLWLIYISSLAYIHFFFIS